MKEDVLLRIAGTEFNLKYNALEVYLSGCEEHPCEGCHNKELWSFEEGEVFDFAVMEKLREYKNNPLVKRVWVLGGEPTDHHLRYLYPLLFFLKENFGEVWLWTRREFDEINPLLFRQVDYVKTGMYLKSKPSYEEPLFGITLASDNQKIIKVS